MDGVLNYYQITDRIGTSGQPTQEQCPINARVSAFMFKYLTLCKSKSRDESTSPILKAWEPKMDAKWKAIIDLSANEVG